MSKLQEKPLTLKREHPALQEMKCINFFLCLWVIFALMDPDPQHCKEPTYRTHCSLKGLSHEIDFENVDEN
jgi:hypothetical protein